MNKSTLVAVFCQKATNCQHDANGEEDDICVEHGGANDVVFE